MEAFNFNEREDVLEDLHHSKQVRHQIGSDDPNFTKLEIGDDCYLPHDGNWERDGKNLGTNTHIKEVTIWGVDEIAEEDFMNFFRGCCCNRSIEKLSFCGCNLFNGEIFGILGPFFKDNRMFESFGIIGCYLNHDVLHALISALSEFKSLKDFEFSRVDDNGTKELIQAVSGHLDLIQLSVYGNEMKRSGCDALAALLKNPLSKLAELTLAENRIDDEGAAVLAVSLSCNSTLKDLDLTQNCDISATGWRALFSAFQNPSCSLEKLSLQGNQIDDGSAVLLVNALSSKLKSLNLFGMIAGNLTMSGWQTLFDPLRRRNCSLEELDLRGNRLSGQAALYLSDALIDNRTLRMLRLSGNLEISIAGWQAFSLVLQRPYSKLENLDLCMAGINDEIVISLTSAFVHNNKTRELDLSHNDQITTTGWETFSIVLASPSSALEKLDLRGNSINDGALVSLANSVANNSKLTELLIKGRRSNLTTDLRDLVSHIDFQMPGPTITQHGWSAISQVLCNTSSIMETYSSNHTLQKLGEEHREDELPEDLRSLLWVNSNNSKREATRLKIIRYHFREGFAAQPFLEMDLKVLPHAIAWMGRDCRQNELNGHFYGFLRTMALLFDVKSKSKKRKWQQ